MQPGDGARHQVVVVRRVEEHQARGLAWRDRERVDREDRAAILRATGGNVCTQCGERRASCSTNVACVAPRDRASRPNAPVPAKISSTCAPSTVSRPPHGACSSMSNSACRARSAVGRVAVPCGAISARPRQAPATILIRSAGAAGGRGSFNTEKQGEDDGGPRRSEYCASREAPSAFSVALRRPPPASPC